VGRLPRSESGELYSELAAPPREADMEDRRYRGSNMQMAFLGISALYLFWFEYLPGRQSIVPHMNGQNMLVLLLL